MTEGMIWGIVGVVFTLIVGVPIAILIARKYSNAVVIRRAVSFEKLSLLTERLGGGLTLTFKGRSLDSVSRTYLALWHERGAAVRGSEILARDPLRIEVDAVDEILQVRVLSRSNPLNELAVQEQEGAHRITFEYLDKLDGGVLEVLHTGSDAARIVGTIPGATLKRPRQAILDASPRSGTVKPSRWWRMTDRRARRRASALLIAVLATVYAASAAFVGASSLVRNPQLVEVSDYDLSTLSGQDAFSTAVNRAGAIDLFNLVSWIIVVVVMTFVAIYMWVNFVRLGRGVPVSILASGDEGVSESSMSEVRMLLDSDTPSVESNSASRDFDSSVFLRAVLAEVARLRDTTKKPEPDSE